MTLIKNETKRKVKAGEVALGFGVHHLRTSAVGMLAAATGHDWVFIDMEHGAFSMQEATQICIAALTAGVSPIVRVAAEAIDEGARALDNGALGVVVPHVDTRGQAERIARAYRYPPAGTRSWGGPPAAFRFKPPAHAEAQALLNDEVLVVAMIESREALSNIEAIAAVDGIDMIAYGHSDLSARLGVHLQLEHPTFKAAVRRIAEACRAYGKLARGSVETEAQIEEYWRMGCQVLNLPGNDITTYLDGLKARASRARDRLKSIGVPAP